MQARIGCRHEVTGQRVDKRYASGLAGAQASMFAAAGVGSPLLLFRRERINPQLAGTGQDGVFKL